MTYPGMTADALQGNTATGMDDHLLEVCLKRFTIGQTGTEAGNSAKRVGCGKAGAVGQAHVLRQTGEQTGDQRVTGPDGAFHRHCGRNRQQRVFLVDEHGAALAHGDHYKLDAIVHQFAARQFDIKFVCQRPPAQFLQFIDIGLDDGRACQHALAQRLAARVQRHALAACFQPGDDRGIERIGYARRQRPCQHEPVTGGRELFDLLEQGLYRLWRRRQAGHVDIGGALPGLIDDFDAGSGFAGDAYKMVSNALTREETFKNFGVILAEEPCYCDLVAAIRQEGGDVDAFAACVELHGLPAIDGVSAKIAHAHGLVNGRIERDGCDFHKLLTSAAVRHSNARCASACNSASECLRISAFTAGMAGTLALSSVTPRPVRISAPFGSLARPPQTPTHFPAWLAACTVWAIMRSTAGCSASACFASCGCRRSIASTYCVRSLVPMEKKSISCAS